MEVEGLGLLPQLPCCISIEPDRFSFAACRAFSCAGVKSMSPPIVDLILDPLAVMTHCQSIVHCPMYLLRSQAHLANVRCPIGFCRVLPEGSEGYHFRGEVDVSRRIPTIGDDMLGFPYPQRYSP